MISEEFFEDFYGLFRGLIGILVFFCYLIGGGFLRIV